MAPSLDDVCDQSHSGEGACVHGRSNSVLGTTESCLSSNFAPSILSESNTSRTAFSRYSKACFGASAWRVITSNGRKIEYSTSFVFLKTVGPLISLSRMPCLALTLNTNLKSFPYSFTNAGDG